MPHSEKNAVCEESNPAEENLSLSILSWAKLSEKNFLGMLVGRYQGLKKAPGFASLTK